MCVKVSHAQKAPGNASFLSDSPDQQVAEPTTIPHSLRLPVQCSFQNTLNSLLPVYLLTRHPSFLGSPLGKNAVSRYFRSD